MVMAVGIFLLRYGKTGMIHTRHNRIIPIFVIVQTNFKIWEIQSRCVGELVARNLAVNHEKE